jgi:hypothetical protein
MANTAKNIVIDAVTAAVETFSEAAICGSEGSRMLVASVPTEASAASTAICSEVEAAGAGAISAAERVSSVMRVPPNRY